MAIKREPPLPTAPPTPAALLGALRAVLPYAEEEYASLVKTAHQDNEEVGQGEAKAAIDQAKAVIKHQEDYERGLRMNRGGLTTETS